MFCCRSQDALFEAGKDIPNVRKLLGFYIFVHRRRQTTMRVQMICNIEEMWVLIGAWRVAKDYHSFLRQIEHC